MGFYVTPASQDSFSWLQQKNIVERFERNVLTLHTYIHKRRERERFYIYYTHHKVTREKWRVSRVTGNVWRWYEKKKKRWCEHKCTTYTHITCCAVDLCHCICTKWEHNKRWSSEIILLNSIFRAYEMLALTLLLHFMALSDRNVPKATQTHTHIYTIHPSRI